MKKLFAVLLALTLVLSMGTIAFAAGTGTITIDNALSGAKYNIYKILDFAPVEGSTTQGRYTVVEEWEDFLAVDGAAYLKTNAETGTIEWNGDESDARKAELAKAAVAYAKGKGIAATATKTAANDGDVTFTDVPLGYYAIDTSLGTICALTNVDNTFNAHEKNEKPDIDKFVQEDSEMNNADEGWGKVNDADIDQVVNYKSTITVGVGATNYVMHDTMEAGLTFNNDVVVKLADGTTVDAANYTVTVSPADGHTFDVAFKNEFIAGLAKGTQFTVYYSATLNENANIVVDGNDNTVKLSYGEDSKWETAEHKTTTYTWKMDVLKYTMDGEKK
ncbi:MAG: isopeptide-forming domain-containing fimbrial protein, partial [Clostridia bacterium]|nr:isopeptide-forming domain-containing fimbrial protein [Clostridia bacterium]